MSQSFKANDLGNNTLQSLLMTLDQAGDGSFVHIDDHTIEFRLSNGVVTTCHIGWKGSDNPEIDEEYTFEITGAVQGESFGS